MIPCPAIVADSLSGIWDSDELCTHGTAEVNLHSLNVSSKFKIEENNGIQNIRCWGFLTKDPISERLQFCVSPPGSNVPTQEGEQYDISVIHIGSLCLSREKVTLVKKAHVAFLSQFVKSKYLNEDFSLIHDRSAYILVPLKNSSVDWELINSICGRPCWERCTRFSANPQPWSLDDILVRTSYNPEAVYGINGLNLEISALSSFPNRLAGPQYMNYVEYYKSRYNIKIENPSKNLISAEIWKSGTISSLKNIVPGKAVHLIPELCEVFCVPMSCLESLKIIPFVLWSMEQEMRFRQFHQIVGKDLDESLFRSAITAPYANSVSNYEKLEFLGDRVVNLLCALSIFLKNSDEMSDTLTARLNKMSSNSALSYLAMSHSTAIGGFIIDSPFERKKWCPQGFQQKRERILSKKTIADVVEALS
eukprot:205243_1